MAVMDSVDAKMDTACRLPTILHGISELPVEEHVFLNLFYCFFFKSMTWFPIWLVIFEKPLELISVTFRILFYGGIFLSYWIMFFFFRLIFENFKVWSLLHY